MHPNNPERQQQGRGPDEYGQQPVGGGPPASPPQSYQEQGGFPMDPSRGQQQGQQGHQDQQGPPAQYGQTPPGQPQGQYGQPQDQGQYGQQGYQQEQFGQQGQQGQGQPVQQGPPSQGGGMQSGGMQGGQFQQQDPGQQGGPVGGPQSGGGAPTQQWHQPPGQSMGQPGQSMGQQPPQQPGMGPGPAAGRQRPQMQPITIDRIIETDVVTTEPDASISSVAESMAKEDVGCVVVVEDEKPVGIVTDRKLGLTLEDPSKVSKMTAEDLVEGDIVTGTTEMSVYEALDRMEENSIRRLPIVDEDEKLEGIVTLDDLLVLFGSELSSAAQIIKAQSPRL